MLVVAFARLTEIAMAQFAQRTAERAWPPLIYTPLIGMLVVWLTTRLFVGAQGSGVSQAIAAKRLAHRGKPVNGLISLRIAFAKTSFGTAFRLGVSAPQFRLRHPSCNFFTASCPMRKSYAVRISFWREVQWVFGSTQYALGGDYTRCGLPASVDWSSPS